MALAGDQLPGRAVQPILVLPRPLPVLPRPLPVLPRPLPVLPRPLLVPQSLEQPVPIPLLVRRQVLVLETARDSAQVAVSVPADVPVSEQVLRLGQGLAASSPWR